jgi:hypothetical protein
VENCSRARRTVLLTRRLDKGVGEQEALNQADRDGNIFGNSLTVIERDEAFATIAPRNGSIATAAKFF